jgi:membrane protease YdiL (CAAX protease family)
MSGETTPDGLDPVADCAPMAPSTFRRRLGAVTEVAVCSGFPTQLLLIGLLGLFGLAPLSADGGLSLSYIVVLSFADAALLLTLVWLFLCLHDEQPAQVLLGSRPAAREIALGTLLVPVALLVVAVFFGLIMQFAPTLRNVPENPLEALIDSPVAVVWFGLVAIVAGGLREEIQRAFVLHRFEQHLGGAAVGLVVFSVAFGLGHLVQGRDAAIVTALLGAFWGVVYLARRSVIAPVVCHAVFNVTEIAIAYGSRSG